MKKIHYSLLLLLSFLFSLYLYAPSLDYYFFQDDFFEINISRAANLKDYLNFFKFRDDIIAYRPMSLQNYFFASLNLFDLNPVGFRLFTFILFFANGFLITSLIAKIFKSNQVGVLTAVLWLTSSVHFMSLTWIAAAYNIIGTFFWLLTSLLFLKFVESQKNFFYLASLAAFVITAGSYEFSVTWPAIFGLYYLYVFKKPVLSSIKLFSPFAIISLIYVGARLLFIQIPQIPEYQVSLNLESAKSLFWYILWAFNVPEELKKQVVANLISMNPIFLSEFWTLTVRSFISFFWVIALAIAVPIFLAVKKKIKLNIKLIFFFLAFFSLAISPVLVLPNHTFAMYLTLASVGLYALLAYFLTATRSTLLSISVILIWFFSSVTTVGFYRHNSWMIEAQKVGRTFTSQMKEKFPTLPPNSVVYYHLPYPWQHQALSQENAIKTIYNDQSLSVYYNMQSMLSSLRSDNKKDNHRYIYIYTE